MPLDDLLKDLATISAPTPTRTSSGGTDRTTTTVVAEGVPCLVQPTGSRQASHRDKRDDGRVQVGSFRLFFAGDPLAPADVLSARHLIAVDGRTYKVVGVVDVNTMGRLLHVDCERLGS